MDTAGRHRSLQRRQHHQQAAYKTPSQYDHHQVDHHQMDHHQMDHHQLDHHQMDHHQVAVSAYQEPLDAPHHTYQLPSSLLGRAGTPTSDNSDATLTDSELALARDSTLLVHNGRW